MASTNPLQVLFGVLTVAGLAAGSSHCGKESGVAPNKGSIDLDETELYRAVTSVPADLLQVVGASLKPVSTLSLRGWLALQTTSSSMRLAGHLLGGSATIPSPIDRPLGQLALGSPSQTALSEEDFAEVVTALAADHLRSGGRDKLRQVTPRVLAAALFETFLSQSLPTSPRSLDLADSSMYHEDRCISPWVTTAIDQWLSDKLWDQHTFRYQPPASSHGRHTAGPYFTYEDGLANVAVNTNKKFPNIDDIVANYALPTPPDGYFKTWQPASPEVRQQLADHIGQCQLQKIGINANPGIQQGLIRLSQLMLDKLSEPTNL